jgi:oligopeptide transport system ATP-binding protein
VEELLDVNDLAVEFATARGTVHAVNHLSFAVRAGEAVAFVGESGSGKSATALAIAGLLPREGGVISGHVRFSGRDLLTLTDSEMREVRGRQIGMVFQDPMTSLNPTLTIGLQITEGMTAHFDISRAEARSRAIELLEWVGIPSPAQRFGQYAHEFSGGMRQRVMIAIALSGQPGLLIADEPTTALDVTIQGQILDLLVRLRTEMKMAIILITHDLAVAAQLAERIHVMYAGRIVEDGPATDIFRATRHPYTLGLLNSIPRLDGPKRRLVPIVGSPPNLLVDDPGCPFMPRCPLAIPRCAVDDPSVDPLPESPAHRVACWVNGPHSEPGSPLPAMSTEFQ